MSLNTPKGFHITAQGRDRRSRTLGNSTPMDPTLKGLHTRPLPANQESGQDAPAPEGKLPSPMILFFMIL